jgi:hypothetical protein
VLQARFDAPMQQLCFTLRRCASSRRGFEILIGRLAGRGRWTLFLDGHQVAEGDAATVAKTSLPGLLAVEQGLQLDCANLTEATGFVLALQAA